MKFENDANQERTDSLAGDPAEAASETVVNAQGEQIALPPGASLEDLSVEGRDLVITLEDGSRIVIPDGAINVPQILIDGVVVPPQTVAALLLGNEPEPAAGAPQSSGGNFADDEGAIQDAFDIGDLLPFTQLAFPEDQEEEIIPASDEEPEVVIETPENPGGVPDATVTVSEDGLPERGDGEVGEPEGTQSESDSESTGGTIVFDSPDGLRAILINGQEITGPGQTFTSPLGTLTITSIDLETGEVGFTYTLEDNTTGEDITDFFEVTVIDADGDEATATLTVNIEDDAPVASDDIGIVPSGSHDAITGDVLVNDVPGADGYDTDGAVQGFSNESGSAEPGETLQGQYGTLTLNADGTYTYVRDINTPGGVEESFEYTIADGDGSTSTAILTIQIEDAPGIITTVPRVGDGTLVAEAGLPPREDGTVGSGEIADDDANNNSDTSETTGAVIEFNSPDGIESVSLNGVELDPDGLPQTVIDDSTGTLIVTGFTFDPVTGDGTITYEFTLGDNTDGDDNTVEVDIRVEDLDGDVAEDTLIIAIEDDEPEATDDSAAPEGEDTPVTIDVFANDTPGADGVTDEEIALVDGTLSGAGSVVYNGDGTFTYTPEPGEEGTVTFDYTITDGDGDESTATVTIELAPDSTPEIAAEGEDTVDEAGLPARGDEPAGSDEASDSEFTTGVIAIDTGNDTIGSLVINGEDVTNGGTVTTSKGVLTVTPVVGGYEYSYELTDNTLTDPDSDSFDVTITDGDGDTASTSITIEIADDTPTAVDDTATQIQEDAPVTVDAFANDTPGADGVALDQIALVDGTLSGTGSVAYNGDGTFTYTPGPGEEGTVTFDYTITDGDGDTSTATVTIELQPDSTPEISAEGEDTVDEAGLPARGTEPAGSDEASDSEFTSGVISINTGNDTIGSLVINGEDVTGGGTVTTAKGVLTVTLSNGVYEYTYELTDNTLSDPDSDSFDISVTDNDGDTASTTIVIAIADDAPDADDDSNSIAAGEFGPVGGNVLDNDTLGADGAGVTSYVGANGSGTAGETVQGMYGSLTIADDGTYTYTRDPGTPGGVTDTFTYTITDGDGDTATADLVIAIADAPTTLDLPVAGEAGTVVDEAGLDGPPAGSDAGSDSETTAGSFTFTAPDAPGIVTIDGVEVTGVGQTFTGSSGTLEITGITNGSISYTYTLGTNTSGDDTSDSFTIRVTDADGDFSEDDLEIAIIDDVPAASADADSVTEDGPLVADGNVLTGSGGTDANATDGAADTPGADGAEVTGVAFGDTGSDVSGNVGTGVTGAYGSLQIDANGDYTYTLDNGNETVQGLDASETLTETFTYTITDGDGDTATTTVTITINGADDPVVITGLDGADAEATFDEDDLADGSSPDAGALTQTGSFDIASQDGLQTLTVGGVTVFDADNPITTPVTIDDPVYGLLTITDVTTTTDANGDVVSATVSYSYELQDNSLLHSGADDGSFTDSFDVVATDTDGSSDTASLDITIIDDTPEATDNSADVAEGDSVTGNVLTDDDGSGVDVPGADGLGSPTGIVEITSVGEGTSQTTVNGDGDLVITTALGTLTVDAVTGEYSYESAANSTNADTTDVFTYTIVDGDGDTSTANLTINITNAPGEVSDNDVSVNEAGLADGSDPTSDSEIDTDGQITVVGSTGTLVYTLLSPADGTYGTLVLDSATGEYTYTLDTPFTDTVDENGTNTVSGAESFDYEVRDTLGNLIGTGSIEVSIIDDIPTATDQPAASVAEDAAGTIGGNVVTDGTPDTDGADGATVTAITIDGATTVVPQDGSDATVITANGTYKIDMDGNWSFDPNPNLDQSGGDIDASFTYTLTDGDGDFDTADQPITITDGAGPTAGPDISLGLDDANLADGSNPAGDDFDSDTIVFTPGSDDIASIVFGDTSGLDGGLTWTRVNDNQIIGEDGGRLVVTLDLAVAGDTATVTATLNDNYDDHPDALSDDLADLGDVDVVATDGDGDTASSTVSIAVSDDLPSISASDPAADALTVDETDLSTDATADFSTLFTSSFGADNPGTPISYALDVNAGSTGLVDTATDEAVVLVLNGGVVEGRTATTDELVFTVSVDSAGAVTLDQQRAVKQADDMDDNDAATLDGANLVTLTATIVDSDGDTATATANIAGALTFLDDGPSLANVALGSSVSVDESGGLTQSATSAASILSFVADFGEDGAASTTFALTVTDTNSGVVTADGDFPITLVQTSATVITGTFNNGSGDQTAFTVEINPDGTVTLNQIVPLEHLVDGDNSALEHDDFLTLDGKIEASVTIEDGDGDTETASVAVGAALAFFDDGPSAALSGVNDGLTVSDTDFGTDDSDDFADNFTFSGGEDGIASTGFALSVTDGSNSGLIDTDTGNSVFLFLEGGAVVGREGTDATDAATGDEVFRVTVDGSGSVKLDQSRAVDHDLSTGSDGSTVSLASDGLVQLIGTVTDNDGDTASAALDIGSNLSFTDDVPALSNVTLGTGVDVDESDAGSPAGFPISDTSTGSVIGFNADFGNDGDGGTAFTLSVDDAASGLATANGDFPITLVQTSATLITGTYDDGTGPQTAFTVEINPDGTVTLTQNVALEHTVDGDNSAGEHDDALTLDGKISATVTITDGDTDTDSGTVAIGGALTFLDDGPSVSAVTNAAAAVEIDETDLAAGAGIIDLGTFTQGADPDVAAGPTLVGTTSTGNILTVTADFGADGDAAGGGLEYKLEVGNPNTGLFTTDGTLIQIISVSDTVVVGVISGTNESAFAFEIDPTTGEITVEQYMSLRHFDGSDANDPVQLAAGSLNAVVTATDDDGDTAETTAVDLSSVITFFDDAPTISAASDPNAVAEVDETDLAAGAGTIDLDTFTQGSDPDVSTDPTVVSATTGGNALSVTSDLGADGSVDGLEYSLVVTNPNTGLFTTDGTLIQMISVSETVVVGVISGTNESAFAFEIDPDTGEVTLEQYMSVRNFDASDPNDPVQLAAGSLAVSLSATDGDGDAAGTTADISANFSFFDDAPAITSPIADEQVLNDADAAPLVGELNFDAGADGPGAVTTIDADVTGLTAGGEPLATSQSGNVLTAYVDNDNSGTLNAGDLEVFTITVDPAAGTSGEYTFDLLVPLDPVISAIDIGTDGAFGVGPSQSVIVSQTSTGDDLVFVTGWEPVGNGGLFTSGELTDWLSGANPDLSQRSDVNGSSAGFGLGNNNLNAGEFMRFDFGPLDDYDGAGSYSPPGGTDLLNAAYATFSVSNFGNGDVVHFVAHYSDGTTESFTLTGTGGNSTETVTITAPAGQTLSFVDVYQESGQVKLDLDEVGTIENSIDVDIPVSLTLTDGDGDPVSDDFVINIFDDAPDAVDDVANTTVVDQDINAAFVLDFSGSVDDSELNLQLNAVKDAAFELFENTTGSVTITLITFSATSNLEGEFTDFASFAAAIDGLNNELGGSRTFRSATDFTDAISEVLTEFTPDPNANNQVFFLSDGNPNQQTGTGGNSLTDSVAAQWQTFIDDNDINVTAIGVGNGINEDRLRDVDLDGAGDPILAENFEDLVETLIEAVTPPISGSVLDNDTAATNGIAVQSITVDGITYVFDGVNTITPSAGSPITGTSFTVTTGFGGELTFDFSDGSYIYEPPAVAVPEVENFQYTVVDADGDTDSAVLRIDIAAVTEATNFAKNDVVITNSGSTVSIDDDWLLSNDEAGTTITGVGSASDGTVARSGGITTFTDTGDAGGSFVYSATHGSDDDNAFVTVNREQAGETILDGTSGNDILVGRDGANDVIDGGEGADIMFGGTGSDDFRIADGDATVTISGSGDAGEISGFDTIVDFDTAVDDLDFTDSGTRIVASDTSGTDGTNSTLTVGGQTIKSHAIQDGIITFSTSDSFSSALTLTTEADLAAAVQYIQSLGNSDDIGENRVVAFVVGNDTYIYNQDRPNINVNEDSLVKLEGVIITDLTTLVTSAIMPIVLDLDGDGAEFVGLDAGVTYDYDGDGIGEATAWVGGDDAILAFDANGDGTVTDASEFVFGNDAMTDLEAVAARFDSNRDGVLDASDDAFADFGVWQDANQNGIADSGEFVSLVDAGITAITLVSDGEISEAAGGDVTVFGTSTFTWSDGSTGEVADSAFATEPGNDNASDGGSSTGLQHFSSTLEAYRSDMRMSEMTLVAAISGAILIDQAIAGDAGMSTLRTGTVGYDLVAFDGELDATAPQAFFAGEAPSELLHAEFDFGVDVGSIEWSGLSGESAIASSSEMIIGLQDRPMELEPYGSDEAGFEAPAMSAFFDGPASGVDQAMEALLAIEPGADALAAGASGDPMVDVIAADANAVIAEITMDAALEQMIEGLTGPAEAAGYLTAKAGTIDTGLLDQMIDNAAHSIGPMAPMDAPLDEAAASTVTA
ncbi:DUF5801 repeats-in-toxin domain-containing protein [Erythrobacter sp. THAF29]|uniref:DUF5801 repeats-in-toxin domain-containing protein n=1 Tax=Erythrobacter sp. THAF29 TaxID=2587851 RepID=UPI001268C653|nr:DUF5801 repeats-in-toxin domain-containing protein [Erythrobacter sp. THAF29]QFT76811.1 Serralysin B precursor [Erythrobacter sp. THAF29]